ncbi:hypothetical protein ACB098_01G366300 [Castanea mollissima]
MSVLKAHLAAASDSIYPGQSLAWNQTLTSKSGIFEMGFFRPGKSHHYNLGIWYKMIAEFTVIWEKDLTYLGSEPGPMALELSNDGLLVTKKGVNYSFLYVHDALSDFPVGVGVGVLLDIGNFILRSKLDNIVLWQTFEEETGTWLPGAKLLLGFNTLTNETKTNFLYSSNRRFSAELEVEENGTGSLVLYNSEYSYTYYYQTIYVGNLSWGELANQYINVSYVSNENESYFIYSVVSPYKFARIIFNDFGELTIYVWAEDLHQWNLVSKAPQQRCEIWGFCGEYGICNQQNVPLCTCPIGFRPRNSSNWDLYDYKEGCERREPLQCSDDKFLTIPNMRFPESSHYLAVKNVEECKLNCLSSCYGVAYSYNNECLIYRGTLINLRLPFNNELGGDLHIRISASELAGSKTKKLKKAAWVIGVPVVLILLTGIVLAIIWRGHYIGVLEEVEFSLILFKYRDLRRATKNFSQKLGEGGFGSVFKGVLPNSTTIAVKKIRSLEQGEKQFRAEVSTLGAIQHVNLLRLRGFCVEASKRFLVYDYMPKGSLESHLFQNASKILDWKTRYQIAIGIAKGLAYLHDNCRDCVMHFDIKPENILLDAEHNPKVADFGLAKVIGRDFSRVLTTIRGTRGYLAPEWISGEAVTPKVDVYSYGKLLFEIVSGRRNMDMLDGEDEEMCNYFPARVAIAINKGEDLLTLLDHKLEGNANMEELTRACKVACWCIQDDPRDRPTMGQVIQILEGVMQVDVPQIPLYFRRLLENPMVVIVSQETETSSSSY